jgi:hypothetical protein
VAPALSNRKSNAKKARAQASFIEMMAMRLAPCCWANSTCAWLSMLDVSAVLKMLGAGGVVMPPCTEAKITVGIFRGFDGLARGKRRVAAATADQRKNLILVHQLLDGGDGRGGVTATVFAHELQLAPVNATGSVDFVEHHLDAIHGQLAVEVNPVRSAPRSCRS